jgi:uncharacterized protein
MSPEYMVDAALVGLDLGETVTIPSLPVRPDGIATKRRTTPCRIRFQAIPAPRYNVRHREQRGAQPRASHGLVA